MEIEDKLGSTKVSGEIGEEAHGIILNIQKQIHNDPELAIMLIKSLIKSKKVDSLNLLVNQRSLLHEAVMQGNLEIVTVLLMAKVKIDLQDEDGNTALHLAFKSEKHLSNETTRLLIGAQTEDSLNKKNILGDTPAQTLLFYSPHSRDKLEIIDLCQAKGLKFFEDELFQKAFQGKTNELQQFLTNTQNILSYWDTNKYNLLHYASAGGHQEVIEGLIIRGFYLDTASSSQCTALHIAAYNRHEKLANWLINSGAETNLVNKLGDTAEKLLKGFEFKKQQRPFSTSLPKLQTTKLDFMQGLADEKDNSNEEIYKTLVNALIDSDFDPICQLVINKKIDINNLKIFNLSPLQFVIFIGITAPKPIVSLLLVLNAGFEKSIFEEFFYGKLTKNYSSAELDQTDSNEFSVLHYAAANGQNEAVKFIVETKKSLINQRSKIKDTPLHTAAKNGFSEVAKILIEHGANTLLTDCNKETIYEITTKLERDDVRIPMLVALHQPIQTSPQSSVHSPKSRVHFSSPITPETEALFREIHGECNIEIIQMHYAMEKKYSELAQICFNSKQECNPNIKNAGKNTPLHIAAQVGFIEGVKLLLSKETNLEARNNENETALDIAKKSNHEDIVNLFNLAYGLQSPTVLHKQKKRKGQKLNANELKKKQAKTEVEQSSSSPGLNK